MKTKMILTGHGRYGTGMLSALELISGPKETVCAIDFEKDDTDVTLKGKFDVAMKEVCNYLVVCDLMGGSPYKESATRSFQNQQIRIVTGANLGGILDTSFKLETFSLDELVENLKQSSQKNLLSFDSTQIVETEPDEGI